MNGDGSWRRRIETAKKFERAVLQSLIARGWTAELFGQGQLSEQVREQLRAVQTPVRWMPDIIAARRYANRNMVVFIDAKHGEAWRRTGNHDIEVAALDAAVAWAEYSQCPTWFVFSDGGVTTPDRWLNAARPGTFYGTGSGTPFLLLDRRVCEPFDSIFGLPQELLCETDAGA